LAKKKPANYHHGDLRSTLIRVSLSIIEKEGLAALTLRRAAKESGVSHAAPYAHFRDLNDLLAAIKEEGFRDLLKIVANAAKKHPPGVAQFSAIAKTYLKFAIQHPATFEIMFHKPLGSEPSFPYTYIDTGRQIFTIATEALAGMLPKGVSKKDIQHRTIASWSAIHGICSLWVGQTLQIIGASEVSPSLEKMADDVIELLAVTIAGAGKQ
jgi:AcrR family transcriptional regulator